jgi:hypothetical protein
MLLRNCADVLLLMLLNILLCLKDNHKLTDQNTKSVLLHEMIHAYLMTHPDEHVRKRQQEQQHPSDFADMCRDIMSRSNEKAEDGKFRDTQVKDACKQPCM